MKTINYLIILVTFILCIISNFVFSQYNLKTMDLRGNIIEIKTKEYSYTNKFGKNSEVGPYKEIIYFSDKGFKIKREMFYYKSDTVKGYFLFKKNKNVITVVEYSKDNKLKGKSVISINEKNIPTMIISYNAKGTPESKVIRKYNSKGNEILFQMYSGNKVLLHQIKEYDINNRLIKINVPPNELLKSMGYGGKEKTITYNYAIKNNLIIEKNEITSNSKKIKKYLYKYENDILVQEIELKNNIAIKKTEYKYDKFNNKVLEKEYERKQEFDEYKLSPQKIKYFIYKYN